MNKPTPPHPRGKCKLYKTVNRALETYAPLLYAALVVGIVVVSLYTVMT